MIHDSFARANHFRVQIDGRDTRARARYAPELLDKTVKATGGRVETLVTDSQYSSRRFREKIAD